MSSVSTQLPARTVGPAESSATDRAEAEVTDVGSLSPSRAGDFMTCPLLYRYRSVDKLPEDPSPAATRGTLVHKVLEDLFDLPASERTHPRAEKMVDPAWEQLVAEEPELAQMFEEDPDAVGEWLKTCRVALERYFDLEDPTRLEPAEREVLVECVTEDRVRLRGIVDRIDIAPGGEVRVVDYKTGRAPGEFFEHKALFQLKFYALVWWRTRGVIPTMLQLIYLGSGEVLRYEPDERDLVTTERKLTALMSAINRAHETGDWPARPSRLCSWCSHQALCPEFGGTVLPLPVVRPTVDSSEDEA